jgi:hypothetical protein
MVEETQSVYNRDFALSLNEDENLRFQDVTDLLEMSRLGAESVDWDHVLRATEDDWKQINGTYQALGIIYH